MILERKFTYEVHGRNKDSFGDPVMGVSRVEAVSAGIVVLVPMMALELTDTSAPKVAENLIIPSDSEIEQLTTGLTRRRNENRNFIEYFGLGEEKSLEAIVEDMAIFAAHAIKEALTLMAMQLVDLSEEEQSAFNKVQARAHHLANPEEIVGDTTAGYGMYL